MVLGVKLERILKGLTASVVIGVFSGCAVMEKVVLGPLDKVEESIDYVFDRERYETEKKYRKEMKELERKEERKRIKNIAEAKEREEERKLLETAILESERKIELTDRMEDFALVRDTQRVIDKIYESNRYRPIGEEIDGTIAERVQYKTIERALKLETKSRDERDFFIKALSEIGWRSIRKSDETKARVIRQGKDIACKLISFDDERSAEAVVRYIDSCYDREGTGMSLTMHRGPIDPNLYFESFGKFMNNDRIKEHLIGIMAKTPSYEQWTVGSNLKWESIVVKIDSGPYHFRVYTSSKRVSHWHPFVDKGIDRGEGEVAFVVRENGPYTPNIKIIRPFGNIDIKTFNEQLKKSKHLNLYKHDYPGTSESFHDSLAKILYHEKEPIYTSEEDAGKHCLKNCAIVNF